MSNYFLGLSVRGDMLLFIQFFFGFVFGCNKSLPLFHPLTRKNYIFLLFLLYSMSWLLMHICQVDMSYAPFIERFHLVFSDIKNYDITEGRPKLALWIEVWLQQCSLRDSLICGLTFLVYALPFIDALVSSDNDQELALIFFFFYEIIYCEIGFLLKINCLMSLILQGSVNVGLHFLLSGGNNCNLGYWIEKFSRWTLIMRGESFISFSELMIWNMSYCFLYISVPSFAVISGEQIEDMFTKPLCIKNFTKYYSKLSMINIYVPTWGE